MPARVHPRALRTASAGRGCITPILPHAPPAGPSAAPRADGSTETITGVPKDLVVEGVPKPDPTRELGQITLATPAYQLLESQSNEFAFLNSYQAQAWTTAFLGARASLPAWTTAGLRPSAGWKPALPGGPPTPGRRGTGLGLVRNQVRVWYAFR